MPALRLTQGAALSRASLAEQLAAYDPTPLFLPSAMSSSASPLEERLGRDLVSPFNPIAPQLTKTRPLAFSSSEEIPQNPVAGLILTERVGDPLAIGRTDEVGSPLAARIGRLEAVESGSGRTVLAMDLSSPVALLEEDWQPLELLGAISRSGMEGDLVVSASSGVAAVDDFFCVHLKVNTRVGAHLPEGFYVFRIGP